MRRTTSALTTTILGAVLAAPTVSAQQSPPARGASAPAAAPAESDAGFGMAAARGARHLLRNGLDYIEYQEFDRALKYLREAEKRQAELNEPEKTRLKQAIERAQRGTRESIGTERPYAVSKRSLRSGGFAPAEAEPAIAARSNKARPAVASEGDDTAEPIRLAGAEAPAPPSGRARSRVASAPAALPDVPEAPAVAFQPKAADPSPAAAPALEPLDELPTAPPVAPIEAVDAGPRPIPTAADLAPAADPQAAAQAQADLTAPFPSLEPPPASDPAVSRSSKAAEPAAAPIQLELPDEVAQEPAAEEPPTPPAPREAAPAAEPVPAEEPAEAPAPTASDAATLAPAAEFKAPSLDDPAFDLPALPAELAEGPADADMALPGLPEDADAALPDLPVEVPAEPAAVPARPAALAARPEPEATPAPVAEPVPAQEPAEAPAPAAEEPAPVAEEPTPAPAAEEPTPAPTRMPEFAPAPTTAPGSAFIPSRGAPTSTLSPDLERHVEEIANAQEQAYRDRIARQTPQPIEGDPADPARDLASDTRTQTQIDISRAPSPAEARPISAVPVPEDWVPLGARAWSPQRKYWAAAATCHMPLYFQDPMLERYGHSVENYMGPAGRFFAYPVDKHTQSTQRNQILQPFASAGQFAFQILTLPYAMIVDPPWEAQYDLGYWRPGDKIPTDLYYLPTHGIGPAGKGKDY